MFHPNLSTKIQQKQLMLKMRQIELFSFDNIFSIVMFIFTADSVWRMLFLVSFSRLSHKGSDPITVSSSQRTCLHCFRYITCTSHPSVFVCLFVCLFACFLYLSCYPSIYPSIYVSKINLWSNHALFAYCDAAVYALYAVWAALPKSFAGRFQSFEWDC